MKLRAHLLAHLLAPALLAGVAAAGGGDLPAYRIEIFQDPPNAAAPSPFRFSDDGVAIGSFLNTSTGFFDGIRWETPDAPVVLSEEHGLLQVEGLGIRNDGTIVGSGSAAPLQAPHGVVLAPDGTVTKLPSLAGDTGVVSAAFARNSSGLIVGRSALVATPFWLSVANDAVVWEDGEITSIGTLGGFFAEARDVNDAGLAIGRSNTATSDFARGFVWDEEAGMREITPPAPGGLAHVQDLNAHGQIAGYATVGSSVVACRWPGPDSPPELMPIPPGATDTLAGGIDDAGRLVGSATLEATGESRAMLWEGGAAHDLNTLLAEPTPLVLASAYDLNEPGQILARGNHPTLGIVDVLLTPLLTGEPHEISVAAGGAQTFQIDAGSDFGGKTYLLLGSLSGTEPGLPVGDLVLPLNVDPYLVFTITDANAPPLSNTLGVLDEDGRAEAAFELPAGSNPTLAGLGLHHAYAVLDPPSPAEVELVSNAVPLALVP